MEKLISGLDAIQRKILLLIMASTIFNHVNAYGLKGKMMMTSEESVANADSITLQSPDVTCRGGSPLLAVTGVKVTWYADPLKTVRLAIGNTYQAVLLDSTTTFYLTQNIQGVESGVTAIKIEVVDAILVDVKTTPASCGKNDGTMTVIGKGGSDRYPLKYKLNDNPSQLSGFFNNLAGGAYKLTIQPLSEGCIVGTDVKIEKKPSPIISAVEPTDPKCGNANGSIRIAAYGGNGALAYSLNGQDFSTTNLFDDLDGGDFTVWVMDDSLCKVSQNISLKESRKLQFNQVEITPTSCGNANGKVALPLAIGNGTLSYNITGRPEQRMNVFDSLQAGSYQVSAKDEDGCTDTLDILVAGSEGPVISQIETRKPTCGLEDGQIIISAAGTGGYSYSLDAREYQRDSSFSQLAQGKFNVTVKDDYGCVVGQNVDLESACSQSFSLPSAFTPNKDGINDGWGIFFSGGSLEVEEITLYNRWGEVIFHNKPGSITSGYTLWDGHYKGNSARGVFTYQIRILLTEGGSHVYVGTVLAL